jgi:chromosome segregation ATPase
MNYSLHASLREEVAGLRKKVVALETAEADNEKLRKDVSKLRVASLEQKSQLELDFMNQLTGVARENALKLEELEVRLAESSNVNRALSVRLKSSPSREMVEKEIEALEAQHRKDLATTIDANKLEIEKTRQQLIKLMESRDQLVEEFDEAKESLAIKEKEIESLKSKQASEGGASLVEVEKIRRQLDGLQTSRHQLMIDLQEAQTNLASKDAEINSIKTQLVSKEAKLEETSRELANLRASHEQVVAELVDSKTTLRMKQAEIDSFKSSQNSADSTNRAEVDKALQQVSKLEAFRDALSQQLEGAKSDLESKQQEIDAIKSTKLLSEASMQKRLDEAKKESSQLESIVQSLELERDQQTTSSDDESSLKSSIQKLETEKTQQRLTTMRLERSNQELTKNYDKETRILKERLNCRDNELTEKRREIRCLESQASEFSGQIATGEEKIEFLQDENSNLKASVRELEVKKKEQQDSSMKQMEELNRELTKKCNRLHEERKVLLASLPNINKDILPTKLFDRQSSAREIDAELANSKTFVGNFSPQFNDHEKRTTQIIRLLEQNLKKEGETKKVMAAGLKAKASTEADQNQIDVMKDETDALKKKLDTERDQTNVLRREMSEFRASHAAPSIPNISERKTSLLNSSPSTPTKSKYSQNQLAGNPASTRMPVRGLVESFEKRASHYVKRHEGDFSSFNAENLEELKDALHLERLQVFELEDELTRQCEMNCSLLKEIASLTQETESSRTRDVNTFHVGNSNERKNIEKLSAELAHLKADLKVAEDDKTYLSSSFEKVTNSDKKEIDRLTAELFTLRNKLSQAQEKLSSVARFELPSKNDHKEVDRLKLQIRQLEDRLSENQRVLQQLQGDKVGGKTEIEKLQKEISALEEERQSTRQQSEEKEMLVSQLEVEIERLQGEASRAMQLETELAKLQVMKSDYYSRGDEINGLKSFVEGLEESLVEADSTKAALQKEQESAAQLDSLVQTLQRDLRAAEDKVGRLSADTTMAKESEQRNSTRVESLALELKQVNEQRDEMEKNCRIHHSTKIESLTTQVDSLVHELEHVKEEREKDELQSVATEEQLNKQIDSLSNELQQVKDQREEWKQQHLLESKDKIANLTLQVDSLSEQLQRVAKERNEAQEQNQIHYSKFDSIRAEIDGKVNQFEIIHVADKEEISCLQKQVKSLEKELNDSLATVEDMKISLQEKEEVEETVENLQRQNQHSLDSQINKLQKELTHTRVTEAETETKLQSLENSIATMQQDSRKALASKEETLVEMRKALGEKEGVIDRLGKEKEHLVLTMQDMTSSRRDEIDELQSELMEMSTRAANQAREVQALKVQLEDGNYRKEEMDRLRKNVRELSQQLASQGRSMVHEEKTSELQLENNELRQRLRDTSFALKGAEDKMRDLVADKGSSKSMQVLRDRNASLKFEVEKLTKKLRRLSERKQMQEQQLSNSARQGRTSDRRSYGSEHSRGDSLEATRFMI